MGGSGRSFPDLADTMTKNLRAALKRKRRTTNQMAEYDRLPPELRAWLADAALPWSAQSVQRIWKKALRDSDGKKDIALAHLSKAENNALKKEAPQTWGASYPVQM